MGPVLFTHGSPEVPPDGVRSPPVRRAVELHLVRARRDTAPPAAPHREPPPARDASARSALSDLCHQRLLTGTAISGIGLVHVLLGLQVAAVLGVLGLVVWACPRLWP
ncbi:hypothetical protein [Umezawaea beigongshangensis]|uniref:hypothetical protein n=1 Tax=Umezawaea beigongshangensis TaxID=2780383 RepID=UPI0018F225FA|nr:hypothetical protein [Umezawaea beigongshangensis]